MISKKLYSQFLLKCTFSILIVALFHPSFSGAQPYCTDVFPIESLGELNTHWMKTVSQRLQAAVLQRKASGIIINQKILGEAIGLGTSQMNRIYSGIYPLTFENAQKISQYLEIEIQWLLAVDLLRDTTFTEEDFAGTSQLTNLRDTFISFIWNSNGASPTSVIENPHFCLDNCTTEELVKELTKRGYKVLLEM